MQEQSWVEVMESERSPREKEKETVGTKVQAGVGGTEGVEHPRNQTGVHIAMPEGNCHLVC